MQKQLFILIASLFTAVLAAAPGEIGFWFDPPEKMVSKEIEGLAVGLPVFDGNEIEGASFALCASIFKSAEGLQATLLGFNSADSMDGIQISFVNLIKKHVSEAAVQLGIVNYSTGNTLQIGLVNINKDGLLPVMILFNLSK